MKAGTGRGQGVGQRDLPTKIEFENNRRIYYLYDAAGTKLRKYYYEDSRLMTTTDYSGPFVYTDHLGNVRVVLTTNPNQHYLSQVTDYYPFGMEIPVSGNSDNQLKYNGKELQMEAKLEWYDYGARFYDPLIGRWNVVDPIAEKHYNYTPYAYVFNNPIKYIDPFGLDSALRAQAVQKAMEYVNKNPGDSYPSNQDKMDGDFRGAPGEKVDCSGMVLDAIKETIQENW